MASQPRFCSDFRPGEPDLSTFPRQRWLGSVRRVLASATDDELGYPDPRGVFALRSALAEYLARTRAAEVSADAISTFGGFASTVGILGELFRNRGITEVAIEDPSLFFVADLLRLVGVKPVPIPVDGEGIQVDLLAASPARAVIVTPAHQYPLGVVMSADRRSALVDWAHQRGGWIVEDDYDGEFRYGNRPLGALQGLDPDRVIYAGTASKSLMPGLRLSWLIVPPSLRLDLRAVKHIRGATSVLDQLALADFIGLGHLDRHLRATRVIYRRRRHQMVEALGPILDAADEFSESAGLHLTVPLPASADDREFVRLAADNDIGLMSLSSHCADVHLGPGLVLGFSRPPSHTFSNALEHLGGFLRAHL